MTKKLSVGGQAVIEGVMMKGPEKMAVAVRQANGEIAVDVKPVSSIRDRYPFFKKPFLRGVVSLVESLVDGMKALSYSAQISGEEEEKLDDKEMALTITVSVLLAVLLFVVVPTGAMRLLQDRGVGPVALNLVEGFLRLGIFLLYIGGISRQQEIQRVFQYHGAEHKTIYTYEHGLPPCRGERASFFDAPSPLRDELPHDCHAHQHLHLCLFGLAQPSRTDHEPHCAHACRGGNQL